MPSSPTCRHGGHHRSGQEDPRSLRGSVRRSFRYRRRLDDGDQGHGPHEHSRKGNEGHAHLLNCVGESANCGLLRRAAPPQEPCFSRDFASRNGPDRTTENRGVPGSSPGLAILKPEIPLGCGIFCSVVQSPLELPAPRAEIVVVSVRGYSRELAWLRALRVAKRGCNPRAGRPSSPFVAFFSRPLESSGVSASDSSDALASACLQPAADKRVVVRAGVQAVCDAAERRLPSRGVGVGVLVTTGSRRGCCTKGSEKLWNLTGGRRGAIHRSDEVRLPLVGHLQPS